MIGQGCTKLGSPYLGMKLGGTMRPSSVKLLFDGALSKGSLFMDIDIPQPPPIGPILDVNFFGTITRVRIQNE